MILLGVIYTESENNGENFTTFCAHNLIAATNIRLFLLPLPLFRTTTRDFAIKLRFD